MRDHAGGMAEFLSQRLWAQKEKELAGRRFLVVEIMISMRRSSAARWEMLAQSLC